MAAKDELGRRGERLAEEYLVGRGLSLLDRNWRCELGELDLVMRDEDWIVAVEVKTRSGTGFGHPLEAITPPKLARVRRLATRWREEHPEIRGASRVDAVAVLLPPDSTPRIEHIVGAFR